jgi:transcriptional regulator with XRE-family HTH domain
VKENRRKARIDIRSLRTSRGLLQREAAEMLGISRAHLASVESGRRGLSLGMMDAIIREFGVKYEDFFAEGRLDAKPESENGG